MSDDVYILIGERIKAAREDRGWTQAQLGEAVGYSQATIGNYELGRRHVGIDDLYKLAEALGKPWAYFLGSDKQIEEEARRDAEAKVRRNVADFVGVRMLPILRQLRAVGDALSAEDLSVTIPVPREFGSAADVVFCISQDCPDSHLNPGDYVFVRRKDSGRFNHVLLADVSRCVGLVNRMSDGGFRWTVSGEPITTETVTVLGEFCGLYTEASFADRKSPEDQSHAGWDALNQDDKRQVQQFIDFLRARRTSQ